MKDLWGEIEGAAIFFGNSVIDNCYDLAKDEVELVNWVLDHFHHDMITLTDKRDYIFKIYQEEMSIPLEELPNGYFFVEEPKQPDEKWQFYSAPFGVMYLWEQSLWNMMEVHISGLNKVTGKYTISFEEM